MAKMTPAQRTASNKRIAQAKADLAKAQKNEAKLVKRATTMTSVVNALKPKNMVKRTKTLLNNATNKPAKVPKNKTTTRNGEKVYVTAIRG